MNKKKLLIFYFCCDCDVNNVHDVYKLHFYGINSYNDIFDKYKFILAFDDINNIEFIEQWKKYIINNVYTNKEIEFIIVQNNSFLREGLYFLNEVILKLEQYKDYLVCFNHSKRDFIYNQSYIYDWIISMYFFNQYKINEIITLLEDENTKYYVHGSLTTKINERTFYIGSFYWFNPEKIVKDKSFNNFLFYINNYLIPSKKNDDVIKHIDDIIRGLAEDWFNYFAAFENLHYWQNNMFISYEFKTDIQYQFYLLFSPYNDSIIDNIYYYNVDDNTKNDLIKYKNDILNKYNLPKTMVYYFYCIYNNSLESYDQYLEYLKRFNIHLECIKRFGKIFNNYKFILAFDDTNDNNIVDFYKNYIKEYLNNYLTEDNVEFIIVQNYPEYREGIHFYNEIIKKLDSYEGLVYFGHNKTDLFANNECIYKWITMSNFINSVNINEIEHKLIYDKYLFYGGLFTNVYVNDTYHYIYAGTFYWLYPKKILEQYSNKVNDIINIKDTVLNIINSKNDVDENIYNQIKMFAELFPSHFDYSQCYWHQNKPIELGICNINGYQYLFNKDNKHISQYWNENLYEELELLSKEEFDNYYKYLNEIKKEVEK